MKIARLVIDIETDANPAAVALMSEPEVLTGNLKDPLKIEAKKQEAKRKAVSDAALSPYYGRILAASLVYRNDKGELFAQTMVRNRLGEPDQDKAETEVVAWVWEQLNAFRTKAPSLGLVPTLGTFNGCGFDIPMLTMRTLLLGGRPILFETNPYTCAGVLSEHLDVMACLRQYEVGREMNSLQHYAKWILKKEPNYGTDLDKSRMGEYDDNLIAKTCEWDAVTTLELAEFCQKYLR